MTESIVETARRIAEIAAKAHQSEAEEFKAARLAAKLRRARPVTALEAIIMLAACRGLTHGCPTAAAANDLRRALDAAMQILVSVSADAPPREFLRYVGCATLARRRDL